MSRSKRRAVIPGSCLVLALLICIPCAPGHAADIDLPVIPLWMARGDSLHEVCEGIAGQEATSGPCEAMLKFDGTQDGYAAWFDPYTATTQIFEGDANFDNWRILRYDVDVALEVTETELPIPYGRVWLAEDLDLDGNIELVVQRGDFGTGGDGYLDILSAPNWTMRGHFVMPGMKVYMNPVAVNIDDDPYLEVYVTPNGLFGSPARAQIIDYDEQTGTFVRTADIAAPFGTAGQTAAGDFDQDGRIEFITGNSLGYGVFEYGNGELRYAGSAVTDSIAGANYVAVVARPRPDGPLDVLTGHSSEWFGYRYQLLQAAGDNTFEISSTFQEITGWVGRAMCSAIDADCDGGDELLMEFYPGFEIREWDAVTGEYVVACSWDRTDYGTTVCVAPVDLNQDTIPEWGMLCYYNVVHRNWFIDLRDTRYMTCSTPPQGCLSWWSLDVTGLGTAQDVWGHANGQYIGDLATFPGKVSGGLGFGGTEDYVQVSGSTAPRLETGDFSLATWYRSGTVASVNPVISKQDTLQNRGWALWIGDGNHIGLQLADGAAGEYTSPNAGTIVDATWHHVAVTVDRDSPAGITFFLDGAIIGVADPTDHMGSLSNGADLYLGSASVLPNETSYLFGVLDEVQVFDRALDPYEIQDMFEADSLGECKPHRSCDCSRQGDIANDDGALDMPDVIGFVNYLFAGDAAPARDLSCPSVDRGDLNCDNFDNALDLCALIDVIFAGKTFPCEPCGATGL